MYVSVVWWMWGGLPQADVVCFSWWMWGGLTQADVVCFSSMVNVRWTHPRAQRSSKMPSGNARYANITSLGITMEIWNKPASVIGHIDIWCDEMKNSTFIVVPFINNALTFQFNKSLRKTEGQKTPKVEISISVDGVTIQDPKTKVQNFTQFTQLWIVKTKIIMKKVKIIIIVLYRMYKIKHSMPQVLSSQIVLLYSHY